MGVQIYPDNCQMTDEALIQLTFAVDDPELEAEERQAIAQRLLRDLRQLDAVERVGRAEDLAPEAGSKPGFATLIGVLTAEVNLQNIRKVLGFLGDRLGDKPLIVSVKVGEQEVKIEAKSRKELAEAEQVAHNLLDRMNRSPDA